MKIFEFNILQFYKNVNCIRLDINNQNRNENMKFP
jgi:hypothetical protein